MASSELLLPVQLDIVRRWVPAGEVGVRRDRMRCSGEDARRDEVGAKRRGIERATYDLLDCALVKVDARTEDGHGGVVGGEQRRAVLSAVASRFAPTRLTAPRRSYYATARPPGAPLLAWLSSTRATTPTDATITSTHLPTRPSSPWHPSPTRPPPYVQPYPTVYLVPPADELLRSTALQECK